MAAPDDVRLALAALRRGVPRTPDAVARACGWRQSFLGCQLDTLDLARARAALAVAGDRTVAVRPEREERDAPALSQELVAALGCATRSAVSQSRDPKRWLDARARRALTPTGLKPWSRTHHRSFLANAREGAARFLADAVAALSHLAPARSGEGRRGRPALPRDPASVARFLGVRPKPGDSIPDVLERWLDRQLERLSSALWGESRTRWSRVRKALDSSWLPRWVRRRCGVAPPHLEPSLVR